MKYDRREIMRTAHKKHHIFGLDMRTALRLAWYEAKKAIQRFNVYGERFGMDSMELIISDVAYEKAEETKWFNRCRYDRITIKAL